MHTTPHLLDVVALLSDVPAHGLLRGQVGTVVELLEGACEVEFAGRQRRSYLQSCPADSRNCLSSPAIIPLLDGVHAGR